jgi:RmlD substrate binding domain
MTAPGETTWYDFAKTILEETARVSGEVSWFVEASRGRPRITKRIIRGTTAEYPTPAARPAYSVLSNSRLVRTFGFELPDWQTQLQRAFSTGYGLNRLAFPVLRIFSQRTLTHQILSADFCVHICSPPSKKSPERGNIGGFGGSPSSGTRLF